MDVLHDLRGESKAAADHSSSLRAVHTRHDNPDHNVHVYEYDIIKRFEFNNLLDEKLQRRDKEINIDKSCQIFRE